MNNLCSITMKVGSKGYNIFLIGLGNIGFRHLQALMKLKKKANIFLIENNSNNLKQIKKKIINNNKKLKLYFYSRIPKIDYVIDSAIISTNADVRYSIIRDLIKNNKVKNLIIEKFAFQKKIHFKKILFLLKKNRTRAYVNCPRRMFPDYKKIKSSLTKNDQINMTVSYSNWNLASNSIHFFDLFNYLVGNKPLKIVYNNFKKNIVKSKKKGFIELKGIIVLESNNGDRLILNDTNINPTIGGIWIESKNYSYLIYEAEEKMIYYNKNKFQFSEKKFTFMKQSNMTNILINNLFNNNKIDLITLKESYILHAMLIDIFKKNLKNNKLYSNSLPIT